MPAFVLPRLSDTMEEGTILEWMVADGTNVAKGEEVVEIEGDKATMAVAADADGRFRILVAAGETVPVLEPIAWIGSDAPAEAGAGSGPPAGAEPEPSAEPAPAPPAPEAAPAAGRRPSVSPVARRFAAEHGIDLAAVTGTGPGGRVVIADVKAAAGAAATPVAPAPAAASQPAASQPAAASGASRSVPATPTQALIARRMSEAKASVPDFQAWVEIEMEAAKAARAARRADGAEPPSYNDFVVAAAARALREFPRLNGSYRNGSFELHERVNVGVAVAAEEALLVPTVFDADRKSAAEIGAEARRLAELGRAGALSAAQMAGATFTVSNLGMFGVTGFRAIVSPPQAAILAVGAVRPRVVPHEGGIAVRDVLVANLSVYHRIVYGAEAARFLALLRELLEQRLEEL